MALVSSAVWRAIASAAGIAGTSDLAEAMTLAKADFGFLQIERSIGVDQSLRFLLPHAHHLRGFFIERHPRQQVFHSLVGRQSGVFIGRNFGTLATFRCIRFLRIRFAFPRQNRGAHDGMFPAVGS